MKLGGSSLRHGIFIMGHEEGKSEGTCSYVIQLKNHHIEKTGEYTRKKKCNIPFIRGFLQLFGQAVSGVNFFEAYFTLVGNLCKQFFNKKLNRENEKVEECEIEIEEGQQKKEISKRKYRQNKISKVFVFLFYIFINLYGFWYLPYSHSNRTVMSYQMSFLLLILNLIIAILILISGIAKTHAAEHMAIVCHEKGLPLTLENIRKQSRFHPSCGTNYLMISILYLVIMNFLLSLVVQDFKIYACITLLFVIFKDSVAFEIWLFSRDKPYCPLNYPGYLWQCITTRKPSDFELEIGRKAVQNVIEG